ncbi:exonuclease [archaeon]|nr:exonuclease [archaeon]|tara:strand:- start:28 stop:750 length:723 start_codon:yes stop_codon:yes gene_type:complete
MITKTFCHIKGITEHKEQQLWRKGITSWDEFLEKPHLHNCPQHACTHVEHSIHHLQNDNLQFFQSLPSNQQWRLYKHAKPCFLDIETTGLSKQRNKVTTIGMFDGEKSNVLINGKDLDEFHARMKQYNMLITFNGKCFDVPFLKHHFPTTDLNMFHVDLRYVMKSLGFSGGLKNIEKDVGISRDEELAEVDGYEAVRLWKRYERGNKQALQTLVEYNRADTVNLKTLMDFAYKRMVAKLQ